MIKKIYNFIFAPPFDGFGPLVVNVLLLTLIANTVIAFPPKVIFWAGLLTYPLLVWTRKKCEELSDYKIKE